VQRTWAQRLKMLEDALSDTRARTVTASSSPATIAAAVPRPAAWMHSHPSFPPWIHTGGCTVPAADAFGGPDWASLLLLGMLLSALCFFVTSGLSVSSVVARVPH